jgi:hypothetical protein
MRDEGYKKEAGETNNEVLGIRTKMMDKEE